jgi:hypothetical protein
VQYDASKLDSEKELCDMLNIQPCGESWKFHLHRGSIPGPSSP